MEEQTRKRLDSVLEDELQRGYRIKELPENLRAQLEFECGLTITRVRFTRLNPARRRKIAQVVQRQYHRDLKDPDILSHEQILKLVQERGEWSDAMDEEMKRLQETTSREMGILFATNHEQDSWSTDLLEASALFRTKLDELVTDEDKRKDVLKRFERWMDYNEDRRELYTERYAAEQGREKYSPDYDYQRLLESVPDMAAVDAINVIDELRDRMHRYVKLQRDRLRLAELQLKHAKIFSDCVEQRRDNAEEMARLYFTAEQVDENDKPIGPLSPEFDKLWDFPETVIQWFLVEVYFFLNGIPDEAREYLQSYGFLAAEAGETISRDGESEQSAESPAPQSSSPASEAAAETVPASSASSPDMTLTTVK